MRVFLDTNIWFSAIATSGLCEALLKKLPDAYDVQSSALVREELRDFLARKLHFDARELELVTGLLDTAVSVPDVPEPADDNDARLAAAATAAGADFFVTGDRRVLDWKIAGAMRIVSPREAWIELFAPHLREAQGDG